MRRNLEVHRGLNAKPFFGLAMGLLFIFMYQIRDAINAFYCNHNVYLKTNNLHKIPCAA